MTRCWFAVVERLPVVGYSNSVPGLESFVCVMVPALWNRVVFVVDPLIELPVVSRVMFAFGVFGSCLFGGHAP